MLDTLKRFLPKNGEEITEEAQNELLEAIAPQFNMTPVQIRKVATDNNIDVVETVKRLAEANKKKMEQYEKVGQDNWTERLRFDNEKQKIIDTYTGKVPDIGKMFLSGSLEQKQAIQVVVASAYAQGAQEAVKNQIGAGLAKQIIELDSGLQLFDVSVFIDTSIAKAEMLLDGFNELYDRMMSRLNKIADPNQRQLNAALYKKIFLGFLTKSGLDEAESMPFLENFTTVAHLADYNPATYGLKSPVNDPASPPSSVIIFPEEKDQVEDDIEEDISDAEYVDIEAREERLAEK